MTAYRLSLHVFETGQTGQHLPRPGTGSNQRIHAQNQPSLHRAASPLQGQKRIHAHQTVSIGHNSTASSPPVGPISMPDRAASLMRITFPSMPQFIPPKRRGPHILSSPPIREGGWAPVALFVADFLVPGISLKSFKNLQGRYSYYQ